MGNEIYIYELLDPDTGETKYIGQSKYPIIRFWQHVDEARHSPLREWIASLLDSDKLPELKVKPQKFSRAQADEVERQLIKMHDAQLLNRRDNDNSCVNYCLHCHKQFTRQKRSKWCSNACKQAAYRARDREVTQ